MSKNASVGKSDSASATTESELLMPAGSKYAGMPIDVSSRRSIQIQPAPSERNLIGEDQSHVTVGYFYQEGSFWRAIFPLDGIDAISGQAFNFSKPRTRIGESGREMVLNKRGLPKRKIPILNHLQIRVTMKPDHPVRLYPLGCDYCGEPVHQVHDFVYSVETIGPTGVDFNLSDAVRGNLLSAHRFLSVQEMVFERLVVQNQWLIESPPIPLNEQEKRDLLILALLRAHRAGMSERYYIIGICGTNNCTSNPFQILDRVVNYRWPQRIGSWLYRLPLSPRFYLRIRGLDSDPSCRKLVRTEFEELIQDNGIQKRKRAFVREQIKIRRAAQALLKSSDPT